MHLRNLRRSNCGISSRIRWLAIFVQKCLAQLCIMVINPGFQVHTACRIQKRCKASSDTMETLVSFFYFLYFICNWDHNKPIYFKDRKMHFRVVHIRIIIYVFVLSKKNIWNFCVCQLKYCTSQKSIKYTSKNCITFIPISVCARTVGSALISPSFRYLSLHVHN